MGCCFCLYGTSFLLKPGKDSFKAWVKGLLHIFHSKEHIALLSKLQKTRLSLKDI